MKIKDKYKGTVFDKKYYASDFTFYNGYIQIENYVLESSKIREIPSHLLNGISHKFTVVQETSRPDHFLFEPYSDLAILLKAIDDYNGQTSIKNRAANAIKAQTAQIINCQ